MYVYAMSLGKTFSEKVSAPRSAKATIKTASLIILALLMASSFLITLPSGIINLGGAYTSSSAYTPSTAVNSNTTNPSTVASNFPLIMSHVENNGILGGLFGSNIIYVTNFGNYTFSRSSPWKLSSFVDRSGEVLASDAMFTIANFSTAVTRSSILAETNSIFSVQYTLASSAGQIGNMTVTYNFNYEPVNNVPLKPKISVDFASSLSDLSVAWAIGISQGHDISTLGNQVVSNIGKSGLTTISSSVTTNGELFVSDNNSDTLLVSWADSGLIPIVQEGQVPAISTTGLQIIFPAGKTNIDPSIASAIGAQSVESASQRKTFYADGLFWSFFVDSNDHIAYTNSVNGSIWQASQETTANASSGRQFSVYNGNSSQVYIAVANGLATGYYFSGLLLNNGTILWSQFSYFTGMTNEGMSDPSIAVDQGNNVWISVYSSDTNYTNAVGFMNYTTGHYLFFKNGNIIQSLQAEPQTGMALGNPSSSTSYNDSTYGFAEEFTVPVNAQWNGSVIIQMAVSSSVTIVLAAYNGSSLDRIGYTSTIISTTSSSCSAYTMTFDSGGEYVDAGAQLIFLVYANAPLTYCASSNQTGTTDIESFSGSPPSSLSGHWNPSNTYEFDIYTPLVNSPLSEYQMPMVGTSGVSSPKTPSLDGSASTCVKGSDTASVSLSTTSNNDLIIVGGSNNGGANFSLPTDTASLSWHQRTLYNPVNSSSSFLVEDYAIAPSTLSSDTITLTTNQSTNFCMVAFGVKNIDVFSPFDPNPGFVYGNYSSSSVYPGVRVNTSNANDFIFGIGGIGSRTSEGGGSGFTLIQSTEGGLRNPISIWSEYQSVTSTESNHAVYFNTQLSSAFVIADALRASSELYSSAYFVYSSNGTLTGFNSSFTGARTVVSTSTFEDNTTDDWIFGDCGGSVSTNGYDGSSHSIVAQGCPSINSGQSIVSKNVTWSGSGSFLLAFAYEFQGAGSNYTEKPSLVLTDANNGSILYQMPIALASQYINSSTTWYTYFKDLGQYADGHDNITISLVTTPGQSANTSTYYDDILVVGQGMPTTTIINSGLPTSDSAASMASDGKGDLYLTYINSTTTDYGIEYQKYNGSAWGAVKTLEYNVTSSDLVHPVISLDNATGNVYVFWAGYPQLNNVYYTFYNASSSSWDSVVNWLNATDITPGFSANDEMVSVSEYAFNGLIGATYETGITSPWSIQYSILTDPPAQGTTNLYRAIQASQDYLTRLQKNSGPTSSCSAGSCPVYTLSEYPSIPLQIRYSDGCWIGIQTPYGSTVNGGNTAGCPSGSNTFSPEITANNSLGTTSENYIYDFISPYDTSGSCSDHYNSPQLGISVTYYGYGGDGPRFEYVVNVNMTKYDQTGSCAAIIFLGNQTINTDVSNSTSPGEIGSYTGYVDTYPSGGGGVNYGFDFNPGSSGTAVVPNPSLDSFRYTTRSGLQAEWKYTLATDQTSVLSPLLNGQNAPALWSDVQNELYNASTPFTIKDVYTPSWFMGQSLPWNFEHNSSLSGGVFTDCNSNNEPGNLANGLTSVGISYPYQSKVCTYGVGLYQDLTWGSDPLVMGGTAIQVLNTYGPNDAIIPWDSSTDSPVTFASSIINSGWYNSTYGIAYDTNCGTSICPESGVFSGDRTPIIAELLTLLGYKYGYSQFQPYADNLINILIETQWGMDTSSANNGCAVGCGIIDNAGSTTDLFRPSNVGGQILGWNPSWQEYNPQSQVSGYLYNMPSEYAGVLPTDQEATQDALIALQTYYNLVVNTNGSTLNDGVQPFYNYVFQNTGRNAVTHLVSANDIYATGMYVLNMNLINEGDGYNRNLNITLDGYNIANYVLGSGTNSTSNPQADKVYSISVPLGVLLSTAQYNIGVTLSTYNYTSPSDWWIVDGSIALTQRPTHLGGGNVSVSISSNVQTGNVPLSVTFTSSVSGGTGPYTYSWNFGDGATSTAADPSHTYTSTGVFYPTLTVTDANSQQSAANLQITATSTVGGGCTPAPSGEVFTYTSYYGISEIGNGGAGASVENVGGCTALSGYVVYNVVMSDGGIYGNSILISIGLVGVDGTAYNSFIETLPVGSYTVQSFVESSDGVSFSSVQSTSISVS